MAWWSFVLNTEVSFSTCMTWEVNSRKEESGSIFLVMSMESFSCQLFQNTIRYLFLVLHFLGNGKVKQHNMLFHFAIFWEMAKLNNTIFGMR